MSASWQVLRGETGYPDALESLGARAPEAIHGVGDRALVRELQLDRAVTIVGARRASPYGRTCAHDLGFGLASAGLVVISGMALGCDSAAHEGALAAGGETIAVLAGGPDSVYPRSKRALHRSIAGAGAVISEHPPGTEAHKHSFPERNRLMAALSGVTIVVEASERSGTRHTADFALELCGRELAAVPGAVTSALSGLPNALIKDGAPLVRDAQDVLDLALGPGQAHFERRGPALESPLALALAAIEAGAASCDALAAAAGTDGADAAVALARLELMGYVTVDAMGRPCRTTLSPPQD